MTDQELKDMEGLPETLSTGHDDYENSLRVAALIKELKRHREAVEFYIRELEKVFTESTINEPKLFDQALGRICGLSREALKRGDEILKGGKENFKSSIT